MITFCILPKPIHCTVVKLRLSCFKNALPVVRLIFTANYAAFGSLPGPWPGCLRAISAQHLHRQAEDVSDLRGIQGARTLAQDQHGDFAESDPPVLDAHRRAR